MSAYNDFVADFPRRCQEVLRFSEPKAKASGREVTLLLLVASGSLLVPYERLRPGLPPHVARDRDSNPEAASRLSKLVSRSFLESDLWKAAAGSWEWRDDIPVRDLKPDSWPELEGSDEMPQKVLVDQVLATIRNGGTCQ